MYTWSYKLSDKTEQLLEGEEVQVKFNYNDTCYFYDDCGNKLGWIPRTENPFDELKDYDVLKLSGRALTLVARKGTSTADNFMVDSYGSEFDLEKAAQYGTSGTTTGRISSSSKAFEAPYIKKESMFTQILNTNKAAAEQAAVLETGRLANVTLKKIVQKRFPMLPETPFNALIVANLASVIATQVKPSPKLQKLTNAMVVQAYGEVYQLIDLEGMIAELLATVDLVEASVTE